jgi:hypothetical protein
MNAIEFLNKKCRLSYHSGFVIDGWVIDVDNAGVTFRTDKQTAFITWNSIRDIKVL